MDANAFMENLKQLFAECDTDNNGCLGREEFRILCAKIGLNEEAADETFDRLDSDNNDRITFAEFAAGFNQYSKSAGSSPQPPTSSPQPQQQHSRSASQSNLSSGGQQVNRSPTATRSQRLGTSPSGPVSLRAKKNVSPLGILSLGSTGSSGNLGSVGSSSGGASGGVLRSSISTSGLATNSSIQEGSVDFLSNSSGEHLLQSTGSAGGGGGGKSDMVVYSSDAFGEYDPQATGSDQFGSMLSSCGSLGQMRNVQDLLDCVQKLQSENQVLSQIFFKDKREREEYISQLGEEFDQQVREVEERANRRAREELENEKRRLREMMAAERETLQHHYSTIEKMSKLVKSPNGKLDDGETIDGVKSKLEDTFVENRRLKQSLLDTKTDVAMIWKEMEKLKKQYEDKLSSAYEKNIETKSECDHIKQQLTLMKDSNKKLQDASDVITSYITEKVEPVIKVATGEDENGEPSSLNSTYNMRLSGQSQSNSRRGSILSEYLNDNGNNDALIMNNSLDGNGSVQSGDLESLGSSFARGGSRSGASSFNRQVGSGGTSGNGGDEADNESLSGGSSGGNFHLRVPKNVSPYKSQLEQQLKQQNQLKQQQQKQLETSKTKDQLTLATKTATTATAAAATATKQPNQLNGNSINESKGSINEQANTKSANETTDQVKSCPANNEQQQQQVATNKSVGGIRNFGRSFFTGSRAASDAKVDEQKATINKTEQLGEQLTKQSLSVDTNDEPVIEPADGPSKATFNIILVGDSFVGKSSFAARFMEGSFVQGLISNCSIDFKTKAYKVDGNNYTVNLWDTAGQERFRSITASYFRKADGIILMYDVTDKRSYLNVRNWMSTISDTAAENVAVLLVGNKIDLRKESNKEKCVPLEEGARLAKEYDIVFLETSVKTGINLVPSMGRLIRLIAKNNMPDEEDDDRIKLNDKNRTFNCMPKNC